MENPIKIDDLGVKTHIFGNIHLLIPAPSNGWYLNPKGWLFMATPTPHPFGTPTQSRMMFSECFEVGPKKLYQLFNGWDAGSPKRW